jgi:hypothetical protein
MGTSETCGVGKHQFLAFFDVGGDRVYLKGKNNWRGRKETATPSSVRDHRGFSENYG